MRKNNGYLFYYYNNAGVHEYWIVDPRRKTVTVNYFEGNVVSVPSPFDSIINGKYP